MSGPAREYPFGAWPSRLGLEQAAAGAVRFSGLHVSGTADGASVLRWSEQRPGDGGRSGLWQSSVGPECSDDIGEDPAGASARSSVNEYGGGAWWVHEYPPAQTSGDQTGDRRATVFWVDAQTQCIRSARGDTQRQVTPDPPEPMSRRYAAGVVTPDGRWIICEREIHDAAGGAGDEPVNDICVVAADGGEPAGLIRNGDFCSGPSLSPDGTTLAWLRWDHPDMPWDAAELWAGALDLSTAGVPAVRDARRVAGGREGGVVHHLDRAVSVCLPVWAPDGRLWWCDDSSDWWHLHAAPAPGLPAVGAGDGSDPLQTRAEEVGEPRWVSGGSRYGFTSDGRVVAASVADGLDQVWIWDPATGDRVNLPGPAFTYVEHLAVSGSSVGIIGGTPDRATSVWCIDLATGTATDLRDTSPLLSADDVSLPEPITFPTTDGAEAHALLYRPRSAVATAPKGERPPLVVRIHGGPTAAARAEFSTSVQFWTTRGFAVVDVNYRGSTGYGRRYRDLLRGQWGIRDVQDCVTVARWLGAHGDIDGDRVVIRGGSSGGFTALEALCHRDDRPEVFAAATSLYGVTDLFALVADTHKFESRYLDGLVGPLPGSEDRYRDRSPLYHADLIDRPVLVLHGALDQVVPPSQASVLLTAMAERSVPHASIFFPDEGHGFRRSETIVAALGAELSFYGQILGFTPADDLPTVNLELS